MFHNERKDTNTVKTMPYPKEFTKHDCENMLQLYIRISMITDYVKYAKEYYHKKFIGNSIQILGVIVDLLILCCWLYILIKSLHTTRKSNLDKTTNFRISKNSIKK